MTREMLDRWLEAYSELLTIAETHDNISERAEKEGNEKRALHHDAIAEEWRTKAEGMLHALEVFGYTVQRQYNPILKHSELVVVENT